MYQQPSGKGVYICEYKHIPTSWIKQIIDNTVKTFYLSYTLYDIIHVKGFDKVF